MAFTRSDATCTESGHREQFNIITAFIDGSNVYGSDDRRAEGLRLKSKGFLRTHSRGPTLPASKEAGGIRGIGGSKAFVAGDMRATEQPGLAAIHSLFLCWNTTDLPHKYPIQTPHFLMRSSINEPGDLSLGKYKILSTMSSYPLSSVPPRWKNTV